MTLISLTEKGQKVISNLDDWEQSLEVALQSLPENILSQLELGLGSVVSTLQKRGHLIVSEPCLGCIYFRPGIGDKNAPHYCQLIQKYLSHEASLKECPEHTPVDELKQAAVELKK